MALAVLFSLGTLFFTFRRTSSKAIGAYGMLTVSDQVADRELVGNLKEKGIGGIVSESVQWVYLEDFSDMKKVPLIDYYDQIEPYDPRHTGYADALSEVFVSQGYRRLFIPLGIEGILSDGLKTKLAAALDGIEYSFVALGGSWPLPLRWILFILALMPAVLLSGIPWIMIAAAPVLASLSYHGPSGLIVSGLLCGSFRLVSEPVREAVRNLLRRSRSVFSPSIRGPAPYDMLIPAILLFAALAVFAFAAFQIFIVGLAILSFAAILCFVLWFEESRGAIHGHLRFLPLAMFKSGKGYLQASMAMGPFVAAGCISLFLASPLAGQESMGADALSSLASLPGISDYRAHILFQEHFSLTRLVSAGPESVDPEVDYVRYALDPQGLVESSADRSSGPRHSTLELPPLEGIMQNIRPFPVPFRFRIVSKDGLVLLVSIGLLLILRLRGAGRTKRLKRTFRVLDRRAAA
jgi:hypothetical protein